MNPKEVKIMLCDDSLLVRKKLKSALEEQGYTGILEASDGLEAVALCREQKPDLVLMDIVMPRKDGIEALKEIKEFDKSIHVVMVSSVGTQGNLIKALKAGADNFMQKPVTIEALNELIHKMAQDRREA
ncbi:response regulator [Paenibacillus mucilaginosus]|uniref:Response regulator receiver protein n=3 Tax=Paenibacillus mucilaginosus TaxID=61624 RepID=H6NKE2_9BACL|nr:response regulator [Paenibacillus mucilaginosus]AEI42735.1 response regulator receiver protein [Paenibacillus mucilaginosus KNP414]AFC32333.1 response regulator receiver protein [Paenibacillus mucilaginosus 3016]AFH64640.1 response regulator receiver [Paenibacillus mucilaginosus K02]MCG7217023.1 response regulator [Paenibacillus mucilaginosus]WDM26111.1 response regulator [Paenibacillus mucilaginosus]